MKYGAAFLVMRYRPPIGRPHGTRRICVAYRAYSISDAIDAAKRNDGPRSAAWIVRVNAPAHRRQKRISVP